MKTSTKWIVYGVSFGLLGGTCLAKGTSNSKESNPTEKAKMQSGYQRSTGFFNAKTLIGTDIKNNQNTDLGHLKDVIFNPKNGQTFAAIEVAHDRYALVPWQALMIGKSTSGKEEITLNTSKQALDAGPTVKGNDWQELNNHSFVQSVYQHYNLQSSSAMGGVNRSALGSHSTGSAKSNNSKS